MAQKIKRIYFFAKGKADGKADMKDLLGGKGAGLAEMTRAGIPVPAGFTIPTTVCLEYFKKGMKLPQNLREDIKQSIKRLESAAGKKFGNKDNPLLVSVRSGAKFSMPGMMDTILNLGLNDQTVAGLADKTGNQRFAYDSYRRFIYMFGDVVLGMGKKVFEEIFEGYKKKLNAADDTAVSPTALKSVVEDFKSIIKSKTKTEFPQDPFQQLFMAVEAVFKSWNNDRAIYYRKQNNIPENLGTAVNIQTMVFGNIGDKSATGVGFTRNPATGEKMFYGEYLTNAQGEDVVAGIRTPRQISELAKEMPAVFRQLKEITTRLERHYRDVQDFEFTIENEKLYMLQTRTGKRTPQAALKIAVDLVKERLITKEQAIKRIEPDKLEQLLHPVFDPKAKYDVIARGLAASPGAASGMVVLDANKAVEWSQKGEAVVLLREETSPDDIHGMDASKGILTRHGGMTSHAAVVARQYGKPAVVGCEALEIDEKTRSVKIGDKLLKEGDHISINGSTGDVIIGKIPFVDPDLTGDFKTIMTWADNIRKLGVRANADTPRDASRARAFGAQGVGLCRTEHMFFAEDRIGVMQKMILSETREERLKYLDMLLEMQRQDFSGILKEMQGLPVTIRLLDPPLHEFLPKREELMVEVARLELQGGNPAVLAEKKKLLARVEELHEFNPMLGLRGARLGIIMPDITRMQVRAIIEAACGLVDKGTKVYPEIMLPVISMVEEMRAQKEIVIQTANEVMKNKNKKIKFLVGTMIELPRAAVTADEIAGEAEFFSFGTNDLTQTTYGFSRDDAGRFISFYRSYSEHCPVCGGRSNKDGVCEVCGYHVTVKPQNILSFDPFATIDVKGVGEIVRMAVGKGRKTRPDIKLGICGEHGGDPMTIHFCHDAGLNYVSCSPYRIPVARLAAAQAALASKEAGGKK
ncbi:MAG: pyruvate, phosphate dikinase [Deltaproteobacteria bacterium]|nr:pyruvate, phosphate dikinase [Deltaproteobacteria bacterium]